MPTGIHYKKRGPEKAVILLLSQCKSTTDAVDQRLAQQNGEKQGTSPLRRSAERLTGNTSKLNRATQS